MRQKISIIGSGHTGSTAALYAAQKGLGDVVLIDIPDYENKAKGIALDIFEATPILSVDSNVIASSEYEATKDSDIVIITAGVARKPGMSRDDLVKINKDVMIQVTENIMKHSKNPTIIVLTNPVDAMAYTVYKHSGLPKNKVIGQSGILDTARFRSFVAEKLNVSVKDVSGFVLGGHGDTMVPLIRYSTVGGIPITDLLSKEEIDHIVARTRNGGAEIVNLLGNGSAYYAPAAACVEMAEAILFDQRRILPTIAYLEGEYGYKDVYLGVPTLIGENGIEKIYELTLTEDEMLALDTSKAAVQKIIDIL